MACSALVGVYLLIPASASAQSASDGDKIQNLEHQTEALQKQLKEIKDELARSRKKAAEQQQQYEAVGRLPRRRRRVAPAQRDGRHGIEFRRDPLSVLADVQRE
jgi:septal ring factor EnvC (AmiA/AmiB activator)